MITIPAGVRVLLATRPVDFRKGAHGLAALAAGVLAEDPFSGVVIVYRARRADRVKLLVWDGSGLVLVWKQLQQGAFRWPPVADGVVRLSPVAFAALFEGLDWTRVGGTPEDSHAHCRRIGSAPRCATRPPRRRRCPRALPPCGRCCWRRWRSATAR